MGDTNTNGNGEALGLHCPRCHCRDLRVRNTIPIPGNRIRRYRVCRHCGRGITTIESTPSQFKPEGK